MAGKQGTLGGKHATMKQLCRAHESLREEFAALQICLERAGILTRESLEVEVHRRRFDAVQRSSQWTPEFGIGDVLDKTCFTSKVVTYSVAAELAALRSTSTTIQLSIEEIGMKLYVVGGFSPNELENSVHRFDPHRSVWEEVGQMRMGYRRCAHAGAVHQSCLYIVGAYTDTRSGLSRTCLKYDFDGRGKWESLPSMVESRARCTLVAVGGLLVVAGGCDLNHTSTSTAECLNTTDNHGARTWRPLPTMLAARDHHAATVVSNQVFLLGGLRTRERRLQETYNSVEIFTLEEHRWRSAAPLLVPVATAVAATIRGKIYLAGGVVPPSFGALDSLFCFDPALELWTTLAPMLKPRCKFGAVVMSGRLFVFGGLSENNGFGVPPVDAYEASMEVFDPRAGIWVMQPPMLSLRFEFSWHASTREHIIL